MCSLNLQLDSNPWYSHDSFQITPMRSIDLFGRSLEEQTVLVEANLACESLFFGSLFRVEY